MFWTNIRGNWSWLYCSVNEIFCRRRLHSPMQVHYFSHVTHFYVSSKPVHDNCHFSSFFFFLEIIVNWVSKKTRLCHCQVDITDWVRNKIHSCFFYFCYWCLWNCHLMCCLLVKRLGREYNDELRGAAYRALLGYSAASPLDSVPTLNLT